MLRQRTKSIPDRESGAPGTGRWGWRSAMRRFCLVLLLACLCFILSKKNCRQPDGPSEEKKKILCAYWPRILSFPLSLVSFSWGGGNNSSSRIVLRTGSQTLYRPILLAAAFTVSNSPLSGISLSSRTHVGSSKIEYSFPAEPDNWRPRC